MHGIRKIEKNSFPRAEKKFITEKLNPHSRFTQSKNAHSRDTEKVSGTLIPRSNLIATESQHG